MAFLNDKNMYTRKIQVYKWEKYRLLTVIEEVTQRWRYRFFLCRCDCGNKTIVRLSELRKTDGTKSCGCAKIKHWLCFSKIYTIYVNIVVRCNNEKADNYKYYGWRGIKCEWKVFEDFKNDMMESYNTHYKHNSWDTTIDRTDVNWNYNKDNCRWLTMKEQQANRTNNIIYKWKCLAEWIDTLNLNYNVVYRKIKTHWWSIEKALWLKE